MSESSPLPWMSNDEFILSTEGIIARVPNHPSNGTRWEIDAPLIVRSVNAVPELMKALAWALPLADLALEQCRMDRCKAGHSDITFKKHDGVMWVGLYQSEWDDRENANAALAKVKP